MSGELTTVLLVASLVLAAVFAAAGVAKLLDREGARAAARSFGVPDRLAGSVATGLPLVELGVAVLLLPSATRWPASAAALALLVVFCVAIVRVMARGEAPECHCFGQLHSAPVGWRTLARNGCLVGLALVVVLAGRDDAGPGGFSWGSRLEAIEWLVLGLALALGLVVVLGAYAVAHVLRSYGRVLVRLEKVEARLRAAGFELEEPDEMPELGLAPGTPAPAFWLPALDGGRVALGDLLEPGRPLLVLFTSPACGPCSVLMPDVARWQREHADELSIVLLSDGDRESVRAEAAAHGLEHVLLDESHAISEAYEANGTPSAVLVSADGMIASWLASGGEWIESLVEEALSGAGSASGLSIGVDVPDLRLDGLDGGEVSLRALVDGPTVVLFWNPGCGFCRAMHDDVLAWEASRPPGAPALLVVSSGSVDDVRAEGFSSTVLLDPEWTAASGLGAGGTPMAVLVDGERRIASSMVTGAVEALALLGATVPATTG